MATVTGFTSSRMLIIENSAIIDGEVVGDDLILEPKGFATAPGTYPKINAGNVRGPIGLTGPTGEVTTAAMNAAIAVAHGTGAITEAQLASGSVTNAKIGALAVQEGNLASSSVTEGKIGTGAVTNDKIGIAAVNGSKIANDSIDSEHYVDGSIDRVHIANDAIDSTKIANSAINSEHYANVSIDNEHLSDDCVNFNEMIDSAAGSTLDAGAIRYMKILDWVFVYGNDTSEGSSIGTLPVGYRPAVAVGAPMVNSVGTSPTYRVIINTTGVIDTSMESNGYGKYWVAFFKAA